MKKQQPPFNKSDIARSFSLAAPNYDHHAFIQKEIGQRMLERLNIISNVPQMVLDVGSGTGLLTRQLQEKYPEAKVVGIDLAHGMNVYANNQQSGHLRKNQPHYFCADAEALPFANESFDLIFSNFTLQWCLYLPLAFQEFKRLLKPNGVLFFSTLGPQTLFELKQSWQAVDDSRHVNDFIDMHEYGDQLLKMRFFDPVVDMEMITVTYQSVQDLLQDLKATGAHNIHHERKRTLTAKSQLATLLKNYEAFKCTDGYPATFEVIYGHAFKVLEQTFASDEEGIVRIPGDRIPILSHS